MKTLNTIRLNKYLSNAGVATRRETLSLLKRGLILINGQPVTKPDIKVDPLSDEIVVNGQKLAKHADLVYLVLNKPLGIVSTTLDESGRQTVIDLVKTPVRVYPVGRLDSDSIGLILFSSDGELTHKLTHPKFHIPKTYQVKVRSQVRPDQLETLNNGVLLKDGLTLPAQVKILEESAESSILEFVIHEGRNRQIRRMCGAVGLEVSELKRVAIGPIKLGSLKEGDFRSLTESEIKLLKKAVKR